MRYSVHTVNDQTVYFSVLCLVWSQGRWSRSQPKPCRSSILDLPSYVKETFIRITGSFPRIFGYEIETNRDIVINTPIVVVAVQQLKPIKSREIIW